MSKRRIEAGTSLPPPTDLERICKGLAALDAMLCEEWQDRYYSFDHAWAPKLGQRMASMRNGHGDDWFMVFEAGGVFMKAFWHEYPHADVATIYEGLPTSLKAQLAATPSGVRSGDIRGAAVGVTRARA